MTEEIIPKISPEETEAEKVRLIGKLIPELKTHGLVDATAFVDEHKQIHKNHTHSGFVRSLVFKMEKMGIVEVIPVEEWQRFYIKELSWDKKYPYWHALRIGASNALLSIIVGILVAATVLLIKGRDQEKIDKQQNSTLQNLNDSVNKLRSDLKTVQDTLAKHK
jgi:outer membrane murein-binding lipoprotein Lpp